MQNTFRFSKLIHNEELVIKSILKPNSGDVDNKRLGREVDMTLLAGNDCAIPVIGRYFSHGVICGFITRFGKCITEGQQTIFAQSIMSVACQ
jgi:hypothetical protein